MAESPLALLASLSGFVQVLAQSPEPTAVASSVVEALTPHLEVSGALMLAARPPLLVPFVTAGTVPLGTAVPLSGDDLAARASREGEVLTAGLDEPTSGARQRICVPMRSAGRPVGVLCLHGNGAPPRSSLEVAMLEAVGSALGMWITHPDSGLPSEHPLDQATLTQCQVQILQLVAAGRTNAAIAAALRFSASTVKQEMRSILQRLDVPTRSAAVRRALELGLLEAPRT